MSGLSVPILVLPLSVEVKVGNFEPTLPQVGNFEPRAGNFEPAMQKLIVQFSVEFCVSE